MEDRGRDSRETTRLVLAGLGASASEIRSKVKRAARKERSREERRRLVPWQRQAPRAMRR